jgi:hypothetical protein
VSTFMHDRGRSVAAAFLGASVALAGCCDENAQCEPAISAAATPVENANLPAAWARSEAGSFRIVVTTGPYRVTDYALEQLRAVMSEPAGLRVQVIEGTDTGLPATGVVGDDWLVTVARRQIPSGTDAVLVVVVVEDTTFADATYGFVDYERSPRLTAVMALHRGPITAAAIGPITLESIESTVAVHEVGHWLGVPARDSHRSRIDGAHCTWGHCVMFKGSRMTPCIVTANLCGGLPIRFCPDCAEELAELQRRREAASTP